MPSRIPISTRAFSTTTRVRAALPSNFHNYRAATPLITAAAKQTPQLGRIAKWYLPTMALIAFGTWLIPSDFFDEPTKRTVTLGESIRHIDYSISQQLGNYNQHVNRAHEMTLEERNRALLDSYGARNSLEDMEKVIAGYEGEEQPKNRNWQMEEAFGDRSSLRHLRKAMELYEVQ